jgi:hypothetical protein
MRELLDLQRYPLIRPDSPAFRDTPYGLSRAA